jgi:hypothetical protein
VLRRLMAPDRPNAPSELTAALDTLHQIAAFGVAALRLTAPAAMLAIAGRAER